MMVVKSPHYAASAVAQNNQGRVWSLGRGPHSKNSLQSPNAKLNVLQCNINGISTSKSKVKLDEILSLADSKGANIICLQETKLKPNHLFKVKGFKILRKDRPSADGGGGLLTLIKDLSFEEIDTPSTTHTELQAFKIHLPNQRPLTIVNTYHPPQKPGPELDLVAHLLNPNILILGDFNSKHQSWGCSLNNTEGSILSTFIDDNNLTIVSHGPTYISHSYGTPQTLDLTITSPSMQQFTKSSTLKSIGSDHLPLLTERQEKPQIQATMSQDIDERKSQLNCYICHLPTLHANHIIVEDLLLHRTCFRCDLCKSLLQIEDYAFEKNSSPKGKFYCQHHFRMMKPDRRWQEMMQRKEAFISGVNDAEENKRILESLMVNANIIPPPKREESGFINFPSHSFESSDSIDNHHLQPPLHTPYRDQTPERVEYENSIEISDEELFTSELEEEELTQKNLGQRSAALGLDESDDDYSDLSTDSEFEEEAFVEELEHSLTADGTRQLAESWRQRHRKLSTDTTEDVNSSEHYTSEEKELNGKRFDSDEDVQKVVQDFCHTLPKSAYKEGIYKLPERWRRCIENQGESSLEDSSTEESNEEQEEPPVIPTIVIQEFSQQNLIEAHNEEFQFVDLEKKADNTNIDQNSINSSAEQIKTESNSSINKDILEAQELIKKSLIKIEKDVLSSDSESAKNIDSGKVFSKRPDPPKSLPLESRSYSGPPTFNHEKDQGQNSSKVIFDSEPSTSSELSYPLVLPYTKLVESPQEFVFLEATNRLQHCLDDLNDSSNFCKSRKTNDSNITPPKENINLEISWECDDLNSPIDNIETTNTFDINRKSPCGDIFSLDQEVSDENLDKNKTTKTHSNEENAYSRKLSAPITKPTSYKGSFVEKIRRLKSNEKNTLYLKSLNINLQKLDFPLLSKSLEKLNIEESSQSSAKLLLEDVKREEIEINQPSTSETQLKSTVYKPTLDCTKAPPVILRHKSNSIRQVFLPNEPRQSVHELIEGVPFVDDEKMPQIEEGMTGSFSPVQSQISMEHEKARKEARARARLKSDEELGLSPSFLRKKYVPTSFNYDELDIDDLIERDDEMDAEIASIDGIYLAKRINIPENEANLLTNQSPTNLDYSEFKTFKEKGFENEFSQICNKSMSQESLSVDYMDLWASSDTNIKPNIQTFPFHEISTPQNATPACLDNVANTSKASFKPEESTKKKNDNYKRGHRKKFIFSILNFGKNGLSKEKQKSKRKKRSSSLPNQLLENKIKIKPISDASFSQGSGDTDKPCSSDKSPSINAKAILEDDVFECDSMHGNGMAPKASAVAAVRNVVKADRRVTIDEIMIQLPPGIEIGRSPIGTIMLDV
ncbi:hypothetical protein LAZ67_X003006 [Cordylochernes scorpioides]|uniref:LIM zinc-binding domain-containing protein n=1 Tax=Cordylochernes scorpioides TaxID=51811 RepID=A0ABY6LYP5_9ARAC|nr:hypothetical protein LAZ67_X003006 [Cordylochernes scorpioides]